MDALEPGLMCSDVEQGHLDPQRHSPGVRVTLSVWWTLALIAVGALFVFQAPAIVCFAAVVGLAGWWCRDLDAQTRETR